MLAQDDSIRVGRRNFKQNIVPFSKKKKKSVKVKECVLNFFLQVCPNRKTNNMVAKSREMAILPIKGPGFLGVVIVDLGTFYTLENLLLVSFPIKQ